MIQGTWWHVSATVSANALTTGSRQTLITVSSANLPVLASFDATIGQFMLEIEMSMSGNGVYLPIVGVFVMPQGQTTAATITDAWLYENAQYLWFVDKLTTVAAYSGNTNLEHATRVRTMRKIPVLGSLFVIIYNGGTGTWPATNTVQVRVEFVWKPALGGP